MFTCVYLHVCVYVCVCMYTSCQEKPRRLNSYRRNVLGPPLLGEVHFISSGLGGEIIVTSRQGVGDLCKGVSRRGLRALELHMNHFRCTSRFPVSICRP